MDVLEDLLTRARARGSVFAASTLRGSWGLAFDGDEGRVSVHPVLAGELWCRVGDQVVHARAGEVVLLRGGAPFALLSAPDATAEPLEEVLAAAGGQRGRRLEMPGDGPVTELLCGAYSFSGLLCSDLVAALPEVVVIPADDPPLAATVDLVRAELVTERPGTSMVLDRLLDVLLVGCLRALWADQLRPPVWAGVPQDPAVGAALRALHSRPAHSWTVAELAREAVLSRAALARRFTAEVGSPPLSYLTAWRMQLAREALLEDGGTLAAVARQVGYASEYAFAAAFKREVGEAPGRWRARQQAAPEPALGSGGSRLLGDPATLRG